MAGRKKIDPMSEAAVEVVDMDRKREELTRLEQADRERMIAQCHEVIGRVQANQLMAKFGNVASLVYLQQVKESKIYRDLPNVGTWDKFCEYIGLSRRKVDEDLLNLSAFGEDFLETCCQLQVGYRDLRKLRQLTHDGAIEIDSEAVQIGDERIPLDPAHREDLEAALERLIDAKDELLQEKDAVIRSNEKLLQSKQDLIRRQEKDLARYEGEAEKKGLLPGEEPFLKKLEIHRTTFDGVLSFLTPDARPLAEDATPRMKAAYLEALGYMRRQIEAAHDTATSLYSTATFDNEWVPPFERESLDASLAAARKKNGKEG